MLPVESQPARIVYPDAEDGACMMLTKDGCRINPVKPRQCRDFPNKWNFPGWRDLCRAREVGEEREA